MAESQLLQTTSSEARVKRQASLDPPLRHFTLDGGPAIEKHLEELCARATRAVEKAIPKSILEGMLLGGGYGRGEGGVLRTPHGEKPYNDLEFYIFLKGPALLTRRKFQPALDHRAHFLSEDADLEIEFRVTSLPKLRRSPPNMFDYDLMMGHRWCIGNEKLLRGCEHHRRSEQIPLTDATRLLLNRCSGLLFARERLLRQNFTPEDADFVGRNIAKAKLALGDVLLTALRQYHWSCLERNRRMSTLSIDLPWLAELKTFHTEGVEFKLHPEKAILNRVDLAEIHEEVSNVALKIWLWLESRRLQSKFSSVAEYALSGINKCPETNPWRNALINLRTFRRRALSRKLGRYPRERLLNSLPLLLWPNEPGDGGQKPEIRSQGTPDSSEFAPKIVDFLQRELPTSSESFRSLVATYRTLWSRFN
jgi:hypothetical protein